MNCPTTNQKYGYLQKVRLKNGKKGRLTHSTRDPRNQGTKQLRQLYIADNPNGIPGRTALKLQSV